MTCMMMLMLMICRCLCMLNTRGVTVGRGRRPCVMLTSGGGVPRCRYWEPEWGARRCGLGWIGGSVTGQIGGEDVW
jgi:hypothetical protein